MEDSLAEQIALEYIFENKNDIENLAIFLHVGGSGIKKFLGKLIKKKLVKVEGTKVFPTIGGLVKISETHRSHISIKHNAQCRKPYHAVENQIAKDVIFLPYPSFSPSHENTAEYSYRVYETGLTLLNLDLDCIIAIDDLLHTGIHYGGFWLLKNQVNKFSGQGVDNLLKSIKKLKLTNYSFKIAFGHHNSVIFINCRCSDKYIDELNMKVYFSNEYDTPYVEILQQLNDTLRPFLNFLNIKELPLGREIEIKSPFKKYDRVGSKNSPFIPKVVDILFFGIGDENYPVIAAIDPSMLCLPLSKEVSPWYVNCKGGFRDDDFTNKQQFNVGHLQVYEFPDTILMSVMLWPYYKQEDQFLKVSMKNMKII